MFIPAWSPEAALELGLGMGEGVVILSLSLMSRMTETLHVSEKPTCEPH